ncbi:MAG: peroxidase [Gammaproteobacteria bacterium CG22_combo_CG10-13_8_21_14_all_40_8]|nr:MAG: peroxidase [Gammaproteobacteria bacterium CG22_combo_CG10-13_8_21_14_all_40_8]
MAFIDIIPPENAEGELKEVYDQVIKSRGAVAEVLRLHSLNPKSLTTHVDLYMGIMFGKSPLKRHIREMMAVVVSKANNCYYCQTHHGEALNNFWKDENRVEQLKADFTQCGLTEKELGLAQYAWQLTQDPSASTQQQIDSLKALGWSDRAILDAALVISYFNFVNRMVLGLGAHIEEHQGKGFVYD